MAANPAKFFLKAQRNIDPGLYYETVNVSSVDWTPTNGGLFRGFHSGSTGTVILKDAGDVTLTFGGLIAGTTYWYGGKQITKTGTTATPLIAILESP